MAGQRLDLVMVGVDGFTAGLDMHPNGEREVTRGHPSPTTITGFEHDHVPAPGTKG